MKALEQIRTHRQVLAELVAILDSEEDAGDAWHAALDDALGRARAAVGAAVSTNGHAEPAEWRGHPLADGGIVVPVVRKAVRLAAGEHVIPIAREEADDPLDPAGWPAPDESARMPPPEAPTEDNTRTCAFTGKQLDLCDCRTCTLYRGERDPDPAPDPVDDGRLRACATCGRAKNVLDFPAMGGGISKSCSDCVSDRNRRSAAKRYGHREPETEKESV